MPTVKAAPAPAQQLGGFLAKYDPVIARQTKAVLAKMRKLCPGAHELIYDNYNALAIAFATGPRVRDVWFSVAVYPRWVSLFFANTMPLPDPTKRLAGSGKTMRHVVLKNGAATLDEPDVAALIAAALKKAGHPFPGGRGVAIVKSISAKQRPRRPG